MKVIFIIIITLFTSIPSSINNKYIEDDINCTAELTVEKNRSFKSAYADGANFKLTLTNTSNTTTSYKLAALNLSSPCSNNPNENLQRRTASKNSDVIVSFKMNNSLKYANKKTKQSNTITLDAGQSKEFIVNAMIPEGSPYNTWSCIEVKASSINCNASTAEVILSVFIPDPNEN